MKKKNNKSLLLFILSFFIALGIRMIFLPRVYTMSVSGDEIFSFWPAAKMAGYDWQGVMNTYRYYGFGYSLLLYPFFLIFKDPIVLYRAMVILMMICQSLVAPISYHLLKRYFNIKNIWVLFFGSIACAFMVSIRAVYTYPEFVYDLMVWLSVWILLKLLHTENAWKKAAFTLLLLMCIGYAYSVHARGITLIGGLLIAVLFFIWVYRKCPVSILVSVFATVLCIGVVRFGMNSVIENVSTHSATAVENTEVVSGLSGIISAFKDPETWTGFINIIVGQLNEAVINTAGLAIFIVIALLVILWKALLRKKEILTVEYQPYVLIGIFCLTCVVVTIGGMALRSAGNVAWTMKNGGDPDVYRQITYFRYYAAYIGPLLMLGIAYFAKKSELLNSWKYKALLVYTLLQGYWILCIIPIVYHYSGCVWSYAPYSFTKPFYDPITLKTYLIGSAFIFFIFMILIIMIKFKKIKLILPLFCVFLIYNYSYNAFFHESARGRANWLETQEGIEFLKNLKMETGIDEVEILPHSISIGGQGSVFIYQFHEPNIKFDEINNKEKADGNIVIGDSASSIKSKLRKKKGYKFYKFGESEVIGLKTKELQDFAEQYGLESIQ